MKIEESVCVSVSLMTDNGIRMMLKIQNKAQLTKQNDNMIGSTTRHNTPEKNWGP